MTDFDNQPRILTDLDIRIDFTELANKIRTSSQRPAIMASAEATLNRVTGCWNPAIVCRWLTIDRAAAGATTLYGRDCAATFNLGHSTCFIEPASHALVAAYTAGTSIEEENSKANANQQFLESYFIDLIALLVLEKTGEMVKRIAEGKADQLGWKVSPFLSPGSIHGWDLEEQHRLCSLLPLGKIGISMREDGVLAPFKSLACLIGIGTDYTSSTVGTTCQVCSKRQSCEMQHAIEG